MRDGTSPMSSKWLLIPLLYGLVGLFLPVCALPMYLHSMQDVRETIKKQEELVRTESKSFGELISKPGKLNQWKSRAVELRHTLDQANIKVGKLLVKPAYEKELLEFATLSKTSVDMCDEVISAVSRLDDEVVNIKDFFFASPKFFEILNLSSNGLKNYQGTFNSAIAFITDKKADSKMLSGLKDDFDVYSNIRTDLENAMPALDWRKRHTAQELSDAALPFLYQGRTFKFGNSQSNDPVALQCYSNLIDGWQVNCLKIIEMEKQDLAWNYTVRQDYAPLMGAIEKDRAAVDEDLKALRKKIDSMQVASGDPRDRVLEPRYVDRTTEQF